MNIDELKEHLDKRLDRLEGPLLGDGSEGKPGLIVRVDRLEQTGKKWKIAILGTAAAVASKFGIDLF